MKIPFSIRLPVLYALMAAMLFGIMAPVSKRMLEDIGPLSLAALLYIGSGIGLFVLLIATRLRKGGRREAEAPLQGRDLPWLAGSIITGGFLAPVILMFSLRITPAATATLLLNFEAVATTMLAAAFFSENIGRRMWAAVGIVTASCVILTWDPAASFGISAGALGVCAACTFWGLDNNLSRSISGKDPLLIVMIKGLAAGMLSLSIALLIGEELPDMYICLAAMAVGFVGYGGLMSVFFMHALRGIGAARTGSLMATSPFFGVAVSFIIFRGPPEAAFLIALPLMCTGVWLILSDRHSHLHHHPAQAHTHRHRHDDGHHEHEHEGGSAASFPEEHSHLHVHEDLYHDHPHMPDIHHLHRH